MPHRLFIGIRPPLHVREALIDTMEALEGARWQDDEHCTLRFASLAQSSARSPAMLPLPWRASPGRHSR
jgi:2'-5' RNA ligase